MNTLSKAALGLLSSGTVGLGGWGLYLNFWMSGFSGEELELLKSLNIPTSNCNDYGKSCDLSSEEQKKIKFSVGTNNDLKIPADRKVKLTIEKASKKEKDIFGENGMKFNLTFSGGSGDIEIKDSNNKIILKPNTNYEFKKKENGQLVRTWKSGEEIAKKIGFKSCTELTGHNVKNCPMSNAKINVFKDGKKIKEMEAEENYKSKNITLANLETEGFNNGFKFSSPEEIKLTTKSSEPQEKITLEKCKDYEIKFIEDDWYLVLKK